MEPYAWTGLILEDLAWLKSKVFSLDSLPPPCDDQVQWFDLIKNYPSGFSQFIKIAVRSSLFDAGPQTVALLKQPGAFQCTHCSETFDTHQECTAHMFGKHRVKSSVRLVISGTICCCRLMDFRTRTKLHHHIAYKL